MILFPKGTSQDFMSHVIHENMTWYRDLNNVQFKIVRFRVDSCEYKIFANDIQILGLQTYFNLNDWEQYDGK